MLKTFRDRLGKLGVHVPAAGLEVSGAHHNLAFEALGHGLYRPRLGGWADLPRELSDAGAARRFVLSCEDFPNRRAVDGVIERILALARATDLNVEIVAYIRPQPDLMDSEYGQKVKSGGCGARFQAYFNAAMQDADYDYNVLFEPWRAAFGARLAVYPLEPARMPEGLLAHFLAVLGAGELAPAVAALPRLNRRIGAKQLEVLRLVTVAFHGEMVDLRTVQRLMKALRGRLPAALPDDPPYSGIGPDERRTAACRFAEGNARFARSHGIDSEGVLFRETLPNAGGLANLAEWTDFSAAERAAATRLVRRITGVDLAETARRYRTAASTDAMTFRPWPEPQRMRGGVSASRRGRAWQVMRRALPGSLRSWLGRIVGRVRTRADPELRYFMARSLVVDVIPGRRLLEMRPAWRPRDPSGRT